MGMSAEGAGGMGSVWPFREGESTDGRLEGLSKKSHETGALIGGGYRWPVSPARFGRVGGAVSVDGSLDSAPRGHVTEQLFTLYINLNT
jgi:hypothetical protein